MTIRPGETIEVYGPNDSGVMGNIEMNECGKLSFFRADGIMFDLSDTLPIDTIFAEILRCRAAQDARVLAFETNMIHIASLAIAAIESSRRKRA